MLTPKYWCTEMLRMPRICDEEISGCAPMIYRFRSITSSAISAISLSRSNATTYFWHRSTALSTSVMRWTGRRFTAEPPERAPRRRLGV